MLNTGRTSLGPVRVLVQTAIDENENDENESVE